MAGAPTNRPFTVPTQDPNPAPAGAIEQDQNDLVNRIDDNSAFQDLESEREPVGQAPRQEDQSAVPQIDEIAKLRQQLEDDREERKAERLQLLGMLNRQQPAPQVVVQAPPQAAPKPVSRSDEEIREALNKDPLGTVRSIAAEAAQEASTRVREELTGRVENVRQETQQQAQLRQRIEQEYNSVKTEYADVYNDPKLGPEFDNECGDEMKRMNGEKWWESFKPTDVGGVAARVYNHWIRSGKIGQTQTSAANGTNGTGLREIINRGPVPHSDRSSSSPGAPRNGSTNGSQGPRTLADLGLSSAEQRAAARVIRDMGLNEATYIANYVASQKDNPNFGKG